uniref:RNA 2',3'-cyclic phosphodiesterase n=1 Tax=Nitratidesulfovibrio vulgaris (strain DSM 19637 / Miyazaki F) TaxID=883 RepID=B8DP27_NITV9
MSGNRRTGPGKAHHRTSPVSDTPGAQAQGTVRCFVGLPLPPQWQDRLAALRDDLHAACATADTTGPGMCDPAPMLLTALADLLRRLHWTPPGNWHLTLRFLGAVPAPRCDEVADALRTISFAPLQLAVGKAGVFPARGDPRVLWLGLAQGAAECAALATAVNAALVPLGFTPEDRPFAPHLTLARLREARREGGQRRAAPPGGESASPPSRPSSHAATDARDALLAAINTRISRAASPWPVCTVREMVLWRSDPGGGRPVYTPLAVLPSRG